MEDEKIIYLECYSGISGDSDGGVPFWILAQTESAGRMRWQAHVDGYDQDRLGEPSKCGIDACDFDDPGRAPRCMTMSIITTSARAPSSRRDDHDHCHDTSIITVITMMNIANP